MASNEGGETREAKRNEKMIEIKVRFHTDKLAGDGRVRPKHARTEGFVRIKTNETHGITNRGKARPFHSLLEITGAIEQVLKDHSIVLHVSDGMKKYIARE